MIIDPKSGKPTASDGPTGREFGIIEVCKDGQYSWQVMTKTPIDALEMAHVMSLLVQSILQNLRTNVVQEKVKQAMQNAGQILKDK